MDYSQLSDFEINKRIADIVMNGTWHVKPSHPDNKTGGWLYGSNGIQTYDLPDYCNSAAEAWPIILKNRISIYPYANEDGWSSTADTSFYVDDDNPLRAAMIVFLMMQDEANANS